MYSVDVVVCAVAAAAAAAAADDDDDDEEDVEEGQFSPSLPAPHFQPLL